MTRLMMIQLRNKTNSLRFLSLSKNLASIVCATRNAIPEPTTILIDMRSIAFNENNEDIKTPQINPIIIIFFAKLSP